MQRSSHTRIVRSYASKQRRRRNGSRITIRASSNPPPNSGGCQCFKIQPDSCLPGTWIFSHCNTLDGGEQRLFHACHAIAQVLQVSTLGDGFGVQRGDLLDVGTGCRRGAGHCMSAKANTSMDTVRCRSGGRTAEESVGACDENDSHSLVLRCVLEFVEEAVNDFLGERISLLRPANGQDADMFAGGAANNDLGRHVCCRPKTSVLWIAEELRFRFNLLVELCLKLSSAGMRWSSSKSGRTIVYKCITINELPRNSSYSVLLDILRKPRRLQSWYRRATATARAT